MVEQVLKSHMVEQQANAEGILAVAVTDRARTCLLANETFCALLGMSPDQVLGKPLAAFSSVWFGRAVNELPFDAIAEGGVASTYVSTAMGERRILLACASGHTVATEAAFVITATMLADAPLPEQWLAYTTHLERSVVAGQHEVDRSREAANEMRDLLFMSISNHPLEEMFDHVYAQAHRLLNATGMVVLWAPDVTAAMDAPEQMEILYVAGTNARLEPALLVDETTLAQLRSQQAPILQQGAESDLGSGATSSLFVPLLVEHIVCGVLVFALADAQLSPGAEQDILWLADQVIIAHGAARLQQKAKTASDLQERERLAREMHDAAMQSIYSITLFAEAGRRLASLGQIDRVQDYLLRLNETAQLALKELRLLLYELQPAVLEQVGLVGALRQRLESVERRTGMSARLEVDADIVLPAFVEDGLYRISQEALNNTLKHASATEVRVHLGVRAGSLKLEICDNGIGFDANDPKIMSGEGMATMRERVRLMHAELFIESAPQKGACVRVLMAIPNSADPFFEQSGLPMQGGAM
jgi:signal transduction histidine kinase